MSTKCGISIPQTFEQSVDVDLIRKFVLRAEELGYESLWVQEQMITDVAILEPVALLTYVAALTSRVRLGTAVLLTVVRNPVELAKTLATIDQLSRGRLIVGVAIGGPTARAPIRRRAQSNEGIVDSAQGDSQRRILEFHGCLDGAEADTEASSSDLVRRADRARIEASRAARRWMDGAGIVIVCGIRQAHGIAQATAGEGKARSQNLFHLEARVYRRR
jgi:hypothetical protein